ncbi:thioesterase-like superfamily-domain-containing protein [Apiosordaria backusii]|uniref:Thioesterase-like superfamily-domain-containing protein n=1 Tax=Apiosordaria backusii TaxID=314023 RepID=A0AA40B2T5_9PEZI|nr:thioesterase-like superfamily-domain-containing protein [Apiosordaria backusii]
MSKTFREQINLQAAPGTDNTYTCSWHTDWAFGITLHGGCIAAGIYQALTTHLTTSPLIAQRNHPDILKLHLEFLAPCTRETSTITIQTLRSGATSTTLQASLTQSNQLKILAIATAVNFDRALAVESNQKDPNWVMGRMKGEFLKFTERMLVLAPRQGHTTNGVHDGHERGVDNTLLTFLTDALPSMSDTLLNNRGAYDAHSIHAKMIHFEAADKENEGKPVVIWNSIEEAMKAQVFNNTVTLDIEFKRRVDPTKNNGWTFIRTMANMLEGGRMDLDVVICDENMELLVVAQQTVLVLEAGRKFSKGRKAAL